MKRKLLYRRVQLIGRNAADGKIIPVEVARRRRATAYVQRVVIPVYSRRKP